MAYPSATLDDYRAECRRLSHDSADLYWSSVDKTAYINRAIQQRDTDTGANRSLISLTLVVGTHTYSYTTLGNTRVLDIIGINLIFGSTRIVLEQRSFTMLNAQFRPWTGSRWMPQAWAKYGGTQVVFGPTPGVAYVTEWDCSLTSAALSGGSDSDVMTGIYTIPVPFYAVYLQKINERMYEEAQFFLDSYYQRIAACQGARAGLLPSAYR